MKIEILEEAGFKWAMEGLARSFNQNVEKMPAVALNLSSKDMGHNKFLESIVVWIRITAPRFWWSEFDTYRVGMTKQSDSTMHTLKRQLLTNKNFEYPINENYIAYLNHLIACNEPIDIIKNALPDGFLQGRTICTNYKVLRNIILQRMNHKLPQWHYFCNEMKKLKYAEYLGIEDWQIAEVNGMSFIGNTYNHTTQSSPAQVRRAERIKTMSNENKEQEPDAPASEWSDLLEGSIDTFGEWVCVDSRRPANTSYVLVHCEGGNITTTFYCDNADHFNFTHGNDLSRKQHGKWSKHFEIARQYGYRITHWMPLPKPPSNAEICRRIITNK